MSPRSQDPDIRSRPGLAPRTDTLEILLDGCGKAATRSASPSIYNPRGPSRLHILAVLYSTRSGVKACPRNIYIISMIGAARNHDSEPRWNYTHCDGKRVYVSSENIVYEDGKQACRGSLNGPFRVVFSRGVKSSQVLILQSSKEQGARITSSQVLTPQSCKEQGARIKKGGGMPRIIFRSHPIPPDVAPVGQCAGSTRLYSARSQTWSCACVLREKAHSSA